jgi:hypothetical protein
MESNLLFDNVALFYYVSHLYMIHTLAMAAALLSGFSWQSMIFLGVTSKGSPMLVGKYGFWLSTVYIIRIGIVLLYPLCDLWKSFKTGTKENGG